MSLQKYIQYDKDLQELSRIDREKIVYSQLKKEADKKFTRISAGSGRVVYDWKDDKVIKLAKNKKGTAQNEAEYNLSRDEYINHIFSYTYYSAQNHSFLVSEKADKIRPHTFKRATGIEWDIFDSFMTYFNIYAGGFENRMFRDSYWGQKYSEDELDDLNENDFVYDVINLISGYELPVGDFTRKSTYGIVNRDGVDHAVIIDYGLTNEVYNKYYKKN